MSKTNYMNDFYKQFEELYKKLDSLLEKNKELINENKKLKKVVENGNYKLKLEMQKEFTKERNELKKTIKTVSTQLEEANKLIKKLQEENDRLKNKNNKNSTNSSKPSSTDTMSPKEKTGANLYNYRKKSNKKVGGQIGHKGYNLEKKKIEELINQNKVEVRVINHTIKGDNKKEPTIKYKIGIKINTYVEKHVFHYDKNSEERLPKEFYTDVTYDNSVKTLALELGAYNVVSYDRTSDFFNVITDGIIKISNGSLVNFLKEFSKKSNISLNNIENNILNSDIKTDETTSKYNKSLMFFRNYSNDKNALYKAHEQKGHKPIEEDNILTRFTGGIMGDHDTTLYSYGTKNYECNIHLGRYLEELIQNITEITWAKKMKNLLFEIKEEKEKLQIKQIDKFEKEVIDNYENRYDEILKLSIKENINIKSTFYKEKANKLYRRLKKYKENHLYFMKDFKVDFDNNASEQDLRVLKIKTKVSGGFRSISVAQCYADALSIIKTAKKQNINPYSAIYQIFNNQVLFND